jgi:hypothetical protein
MVTFSLHFDWTMLGSGFRLPADSFWVGGHFKEGKARVG